MPIIRPASPQTVAANRARDQAVQAFARGDVQTAEDCMAQAAECKPQRGFEFGDLCMENEAPEGAVRCYRLTPLDPPRITARQRFEKQGDAFARMVSAGDGIRIPCAILAVQCYSGAFADEPGAYAPHLKRFEVLSDAFCAKRFGLDWFALRRFWESHPDTDPSSGDRTRRAFAVDLFAELVKELADTTRLLPFPQQLHDASFTWPWVMRDDESSIEALREHIVPLLEDLLMHRLPDVARHTTALDCAALTATGNLAALPAFTRITGDMLLAYQRQFPLTERTLDAFVDACRNMSQEAVALDEFTDQLRAVCDQLPPPLRERFVTLANGSIPVKHKFACVTTNPAAITLPHAERWYDADPGLHNAMSTDRVLNLDALGRSFPSTLSGNALRDFLEDLNEGPSTRMRIDIPERSETGTPNGSDSD